MMPGEEDISRNYNTFLYSEMAKAGFLAGEETCLLASDDQLLHPAEHLVKTLGIQHAMKLRSGTNIPPFFLWIYHPAKDKTPPD